MKSNLSFSEIHDVVERFYAKATKDILIGFKFAHIQDLKPHVERIAYFWQLQLTGSIERPEHLPFQIIDIHRPMKLTSGMVDRWIVLFHQTLAESNLSTDDQSLWKAKIELFRDRMKAIQVTS